MIQRNGIGKVKRRFEFIREKAQKQLQIGFRPFKLGVFEEWKVQISERGINERIAKFQ